MPKVPPRVVQPWLPWWATPLVSFLAALYFLSVFVEAVHPGRTVKLVGRPAAYFSQLADLFATRSIMSIDFRVEAFRCDTHQFRELDVSPYFPMHAQDKESRFARAMYFYLHDRKVLVALQDYLIASHNARVAAGEPTDLPKIGGVEFVSLRIPIPKPGTDFPPWSRPPLASRPPTWKSKTWFITPKREWLRRCGEAAP